MSVNVDTFSSKVSLNMLTNFSHTVIMAVVGFMMVPYYIGEFGLAIYAIIPLSITITTYFIALSDCLASAFTRYMGVAVHGGNHEDINRTFTTSLSGMGKTLIIITPFVVLVSFLSPYVFDISDSAVHDVQALFLMIMASSMLISFSSCLSSVFMAYNKIYITSVSKIIHCISQVAIVLVLFDLFGPHLQILGMSYLVASILQIGILTLSIRYVCPTLKVSRRYYDSTLLREMGGLGLWSTASEFGSLLFIQASMIVVNLMLGSEQQGSFSIVANMSSMIGTACTSLGVVATPLLYRAYANNDREGVVRTLRIFTKFVGMLMAFPLAYLMIFAPQVLEVWLGPGYEDLYPMIYLLMPIEIIICTVNSLIAVPIVYLKVKKVVISTVLCGILNVVLGIIFVNYTEMGMFGALLAWAISIFVLKFLFYPSYTSKLTSDSIWKYYPALLWAYSSLAAVLIIGYGMTFVFTLPATWFAVLTSFLVMFLVYFTIVSKFAFNFEEKKVIITYLPGFMQRFFCN